MMGRHYHLEMVETPITGGVISEQSQKKVKDICHPCSIVINVNVVLCNTSQLCMSSHVQVVIMMNELLH